MFFSPPEVKSLSQYSQFGSHNARTEFLATFTLTVLLHIIIVAIYSMSPREEATKVTVRVLNIKFSGDSAGEDNEPQGGKNTPSSQTGIFGGANIQNGIATQAAGSDNNQVIEIINKGIAKQRIVKAPDVQKNDTVDTIAKPKKYVREGQSEVDLTRSGNGKGNGSGITGSKEGDEIIERYTQEISLLVEKHKRLNQNLDGKTLVRMRVNREGTILFRKIEVSSGNTTIDQAALEMIDTTGKLPAFPEKYPEDEMEFLLPVSFILQ